MCDGLKEGRKEGSTGVTEVRNEGGKDWGTGVTEERKEGSAGVK